MALFVIAAAVRVGWVVLRYAHNPDLLQYPDEEAYLLAARSLAAGHGLIEEFGFRATYMPGYPAFLAAFLPLPQPLCWARIAQALLAAWVAPATMLLAMAWQQLAWQQPVTPPFTRGGQGEGESIPGRAAWPLMLPVFAGLLAAVDPFLVFFSGLLLTEALFAAVLVSAWALVLRLADASTRHWLAWAFVAGILFLTAVMLRPAAAVLVIAAVPAVVAARGASPPLAPRYQTGELGERARALRRALASVGLMLAVVIIGLLPWAARNARTIGRWEWLTTRGGISLYDGLREAAGGESDLAFTKTLPEVRGLSETEWDDYFRAHALMDACHDPLRVVRLAGAKFLRTWSLLPHVEGYRSGPLALVSAAWTGLILLTAAAGWWRTRRRIRAWALLLLPVVLVTALHMIYVGSLRYRVPVMPMLMVLSAAGVSLRCSASSADAPRKPLGTGDVPGGDRPAGDRLSAHLDCRPAAGGGLRPHFSTVILDVATSPGSASAALPRRCPNQVVSGT